jgi:hypothetical protein
VQVVASNTGWVCSRVQGGCAHGGWGGGAFLIWAKSVRNLLLSNQLALQIYIVSKNYKLEELSLYDEAYYWAKNNLVLTWKYMKAMVTAEAPSCFLQRITFMYHQETLSCVTQNITGDWVTAGRRACVVSDCWAACVVSGDDLRSEKFLSLRKQAGTDKQMRNMVGKVQFKLPSYKYVL